jgi:hypothetical protein
MILGKMDLKRCCHVSGGTIGKRENNKGGGGINRKNRAHRCHREGEKPYDAKFCGKPILSHLKRHQRLCTCENGSIKGGKRKKYISF